MFILKSFLINQIPPSKKIDYKFTTDMKKKRIILFAIIIWILSNIGEALNNTGIALDASSGYIIGRIIGKVLISVLLAIGIEWGVSRFAKK